MPSNYRFRKNWRGQFILQVSYEHHHGPDLWGHGFSELRWRDANGKDFNNSFFDRRKKP